MFGKPERPAVCSGFHADEDTCGSTNEEAFELLRELEESTLPGKA
ncbi:hypothetical protein ABH892_003584 [Paenibacillus sp. RC254]